MKLAVFQYIKNKPTKIDCIFSGKEDFESLLALFSFGNQVSGSQLSPMPTKLKKNEAQLEMYTSSEVRSKR
jgi:hypothetical protein